MGTWNGIELQDLELASDELRLRPWHPDDAQQVAEIMRDERMSDYLPLPRPYTLEDAQAYVNDFAAEGRRAGNRIEWAVEADGRIVAAAGLQLPVNGAQAGIGYWVAGDRWGRGYATRVIRSLADFGFAQGLHRIQVKTHVANTASAAAALRAGFRFETVLRQSDRGQHGYADHALFARLAEDPGAPVSPALPRLDHLTDHTVILRPVRAEDWPVLYAEAANEESRRWGFGDQPSEEKARSRAAAAGLFWLVGRGAELVILDAQTDDPAGLVSLRQSGPPGVLALGYGVLPEFRGRRFTSRALRLVADWVFSATAIARLELGCKLDNVASARSAELAGFTPEGRFAGRLVNPDGSYSDELAFGLVKPGSASSG